MKPPLIFIVPLLIAFGATPSAPAVVHIITTTPTLADISRNIGGSFVKVQSIMRGPENIHNIKAKPSHMIKLRKADLFIHGGLDAELWAPLLIRGARRPKLMPGQPGNVDVSRGIHLRDVPKRGELTRAKGDIHVFGNTHYALDPLNGIIIARTITTALRQADPGHAGAFEANFEDFRTRIEALTHQLVASMKPYRGVPIVIYHRTWPYFLARFGMVTIGEIEPKPGLAPGPQHLVDIVETMKSRGSKIVIVETFNSRKNAEQVAVRAGGHAVVLAQEVNALPEVDSYEALFKYNIQTLLNAFHEAGIEPHISSVDIPTSSTPTS